MKSENEISQLVQMEAPKYNFNPFRNNSGALRDATGRVVRFGLGNTSKRINENFKSSDFIGPTTIIITPEMIGKKIAIFTAIETKEENWKFNFNDPHEVAQKNFIDFVNLKGGIAFFANGIDSFHRGMMESLNRFLIK